MGNLIPSNNNDDNLDFSPTQLPGCKVWLDASDEATVFTTDYQGSVSVADNFIPTSISGCASWYDSSDSSTLYNTSAGPISAATNPLAVSGCSLWLDSNDQSTLFTTSSGPFSTVSSPTGVSGCAIWFDATDSSSIILDTNNKVSEWRNKANNSFYASQSSETNRPSVISYNGQNVIRFDGYNNNYLTTNITGVLNTNNQNFTAFIVYQRYTSIDVTRDVLLGQGTAGCFQTAIFLYPGNPGTVAFYANGPQNGFSTASSNTTQILSVSQSSGNLWNGYRNGIQYIQNVSVSGRSSYLLSNIGSSCNGASAFDGHIAEIILYDRDLSSSERAGVENYLSTKWGLSAPHAQSGSGQSIGYWADKSGNNYHAIQTGASNRPLRASFPLSDKNGISFTKSQTHYLTINNYPYTTSSNFTLFVVFKPSTLSSNDVILGRNHSTCFATALWYSGNITLRSNDGGQYPLYNDLNPSVLTITRSSSANHSIFRNGNHSTEIAMFSANATSLSDLLSTIGASCSGNYPYDGHIGEIIAFNRNLSIDERASIEKYLLAKWNMTDPHIQSVSNGSIGYWGDKSGNNRHATQTISAYRPTRSGTINSLPAITFDGTDDNLLIGDLSSVFPSFGEVFIIFEPNNTTTYALYQTKVNYAYFGYAGQTNFGYFTNTRSSNVVWDIPSSGVNLTSVRSDGGNLTVRINGNNFYSQSSLGHSGGDSHAIGYTSNGGGANAGIMMNGKIVEIITYNRDIGSENRAKVEQYLAKKWGIQDRLHDYSNQVGEKIGYWKNKGSVNFGVSQYRNMKRPLLGLLNNKRAVSFDDINSQYLTGNILGGDMLPNGECSFFWVTNITTNAAPGSHVVFMYGNYNSYNLISKWDTKIEYGGSNGINLTSPPQTKNMPIVEGVIKGNGTIFSSTNAFRNGITLSKSYLGADGSLSVGSAWSLPLMINSYNPGSFSGAGAMTIGEFIGYNRTVSDDERKLIEKYLQNKWNINRLNQSISKPTDISGCSLWLDSDDSKTLFTDFQATTNPTLDGQNIAYWTDKAGGQDVMQNTLSARPTYKTNILNGKPALYFDGGDDLLSAVNRQTTGPCTIIVVCRADSHSGDLSGILTFGDNTGGNSGPGIIYYGGSNYTVVSDGLGATAALSSNSNQSILGTPSIISSVYTQTRTTNSYLYINGVFQEYYTGAGVALASTSNRVQVGARTGGGNNTRRLVGYIAECIVYDRALKDNERALVENYLAQKWGMNSYSSPVDIGSSIKLHNIVVSNKDAQNWVDRVFQNGGTVSQKTADRVNDFCKKIDAAGLRKKFYRLNLFCGNDLNACLTPLYLGPDNQTFYGNRIESNSGFVGSNYDEKNGLISNTQGNYLLTGVSADNIGCSYSGHMAFYQTQYNIDTNKYPNGNRMIMGGGSVNIGMHDFTDGHNIYSYYGTSIIANSSYYGGLFISNRSNDSTLKIYEQGSILTTNSSTETYLPQQTSQIGIFANTVASVSSGFTYTGGYLKGYSFGQSMSNGEVILYNSIMESLQASLGRGLQTRASAQFTSVNNSDAQSWIDAVYANGGTVSTSTALAVNNFCNSIDSAGLRNKFYRLNLFCGNSLSSVFVPLYRGNTKNGTIYGNTKDINTSLDGFGYYANSDNFSYTENQGLLGNTQEIAGNSYVSRRYLNTGLITGNISQLNNNLHYTIYSKNLTDGGYAMGAYDGANTGFSLQVLLEGYNVGAFANGLLNHTTTSTTRIFPSRKGLYVGNYNNYILNLYEGRGYVVGQKDLTSTYALVPVTTSPVGIFGENRATLAIALFNYLDRLQGYSIGSSLTTTDVQNYYDIMQTFQSALSRAQQTTLSSTFDSITNADARDWLTRVYENGGTVSLATATAVQDFCNTIDSAGLRSKFFRLNLFCGDNLNAATVPLYRGQSVSGIQHGFLVERSTNLISSDYNESGSFAGIKGNGSNKRLDTGLGTDFTNTSSLSFGAFISEPTSTAFSVYLGTAQNTNADTTILYYRDGFTRGLDGVTFYPSEPANATLFGYHAYSRTASNSYFHSWNGVSGTISTSASAARGADSFMIHAFNNNGTAANYGDGRISMYHIGLGLTSAEATTLYNAINTFNTSMNRTRPSSSFASVTNEDAKIWIDNVYYNGGTVSSNTANLVNTFCNSIDSAGLRNKFYRVNLFCGDNLSASLVPVYRGPTKTTVYGGVKTDTNNNFVSADYSENSGLIGNASTKWLDTLLPQNFATYRHLGVVMNKLPSTPYRMIMGAKANATEGNYTSEFRLQTDGNINTASFWTGNASGQLAVGVSLTLAEKTFVIALSDSDNINKIYGDNYVGTSSSTISSPDTTSIGVFAQKAGSNSTASAHTDARFSLYTIGINLSSSEIATLTSIIDAFNDGLGRGKPSNTFTAVNNTEAKRWINNVYTNGGTLSTNTANAVNTFTNTIDSIGIRSKIWRLNLFCGNNINAALVPLYRGPSEASSNYGSSVDGNNNFISSDYSESGNTAGLKGNGSNKYLTTGLGMNIFGISDRHLMVYESSVSTNAYATLIQGGYDFTIPYGLWFLAYGSPATSPRYGSFGDSSYAIAPSYGVPGMFLGTGTSTSSEIYRNGVLVGTASSSTPGELDASAIIVGAGYAPGGSIVQHINGSISSYSIGNKLTAQQASAFYNALETFNQAISRGRASNSFSSSVTNQDAKLWIDAVYANGGTVSSTTASAINTFCNSIDSAGLRNKFYRLNLFCGNNINAALVPLYKGLSYDGAVTGYTFDNNNGFLNTDYNEVGASAGIQGNGNKYLDTGIFSSSLPISNRHLYVEEKTMPGDYNISIGIRYAGDAIAQSQAFYVYRDPQNRTSFAFAESINFLVNNHTPSQLLCSNYDSGSGKVYRDGVLVGTGTGYPVSTGYANGTVTVFGGRQIYEGTITAKTTARLASYSLGLALNDIEAYRFYNIVAAFNATINR